MWTPLGQNGECVCVCRFVSVRFALCSLYRYMYIAPDLCECVCVCMRV